MISPHQPNQPGMISGVRGSVLAALGLVALTVAAYGPLWRNDFINLDDDFYVTSNPHVLKGLTIDNVHWAWTTFHSGNWIPLTWMSLQLDASLFHTVGPGGRVIPWAPGFHAQNLLWHCATVVVLFFALCRLTGAFWRSALVAALFAVHPLHVESVAWAAERKDVLSVFFGALTLLAYARYVAAPSPGRYWAIVVPFLFGLLAKQMLVTLPFALLLLDAWPLSRWSRKEAAPAPAKSRGRGRQAKQAPVAADPSPGGSGKRTLGELVREKLPLLALGLLGSIIAATAQRAENAIMPLSRLALPPRLANAVYSYGWYLWKTFWPTNLAIYYPHPEESWQWGPVLLFGGILLAVTAVALRWAKRWPWLPVGWFWFLGTLVPVIGLVQLGDQGRADRYTYLPHIGLFLALVWGAAAMVDRLRIPRIAAGVIAAACTTLLAVATWDQVSRWKDTAAVWRHAVAVTENNYRAHASLGRLLLLQGRQTLDTQQALDLLRQACEHWDRAVDLHPNVPGDRYDYGSALLTVGRLNAAERQFRAAVHLDPANVEAWHSLGATVLRLGRPEDAVTAFTRVLTLVPSQADSRSLLGLALWRLGRFGEAEREWQAVLEAPSGNAEALAGWGLVQIRRGHPEQAVPLLSEAVRINPGMSWAWSACGVALGRKGDWAGAVLHQRNAVQIEEERARALTWSLVAERSLYHRRLAHALREAGRSGDAEQEYLAARELDPDWPKQAVTAAWQLATDPRPERRDAAAAVDLAAQACEALADPGAEALDALAAALAADGQFEAAVTTARRAVTRATPTLATAITERLDLYQQKKAFIDKRPEASLPR